jgi:hypothetical protein
MNNKIIKNKKINKNGTFCKKVGKQENQSINGVSLGTTHRCFGKVLIYITYFIVRLICI